jgi:hypothetical protein
MIHILLKEGSGIKPGTVQPASSARAQQEWPLPYDPGTAIPQVDAPDQAALKKT